MPSVVQAKDLGLCCDSTLMPVNIRLYAKS